MSRALKSTSVLQRTQPRPLAKRGRKTRAGGERVVVYRRVSRGRWALPGRAPSPSLRPPSLTEQLPGSPSSMSLLKASPGASIQRKKRRRATISPLWGKWRGTQGSISWLFCVCERYAPTEIVGWSVSEKKGDSWEAYGGPSGLWRGPQPWAWAWACSPGGTRLQVGSSRF